MNTVVTTTMPIVELIVGVSVALAASNAIAAGVAWRCKESLSVRPEDPVPTVYGDSLIRGLENMDGPTEALQGEGSVELHGRKLGMLAARLIHEVKLQYPIITHDAANERLVQRFVKEELDEIRDMRTFDKSLVMRFVLVAAFQRDEADRVLDTVMATTALRSRAEGDPHWYERWKRSWGWSSNFGVRGTVYEHSMLYGWRRVAAPHSRRAAAET